MSENPILREARAAVFAAVAVLVGAFGHDAFSPTDIPVWALASCVALLYVAIRPFTRRERGLPSIVGAMGVVQLALHTAFASAQQHAGAAMPDMQMAAAAHHLPPIGAWWCGPKAPAGMADMMMYHAAGMPNAAANSAMNSAAHSMTIGMFASHVSAALVASWWLWQGEAAVWELARALVLLVAEPLRLLVAGLATFAAPPRRSPAGAAFDTRDRLGPGRLIRFSVARRGPPAVAAFC
jgi:hypothetical protein